MRTETSSGFDVLSIFSNCFANGLLNLPSKRYFCLPQLTAGDQINSFMNFRKVNNITGWVVGVIACAVYFLSREATGSFWDCGEFVSSAYKLQLPHPPGAPLFVLVGRFFIILFGNSPTSAAHAVNMMSAFASGFTILLLFWTITHFARKMFVTVGEEMSQQQIITVMSAGVVGSMAYCFSDSFWFSAVEGEVYGLSSFFTAITFWGMLKWSMLMNEPAMIWPQEAALTGGSSSSSS